MKTTLKLSVLLFCLACLITSCDKTPANDITIIKEQEPMKEGAINVTLQGGLLIGRGLRYAIVAGTDSLVGVQGAVTLNDQMPFLDNPVIPPYVYYDGKNYPVTTIGDAVFQDKKELTEITLPETLEIIGRYALSGTSLSSIVIPGGMKEIHGYAFYKCEELASVVIGENVTRINSSVFWDCENLSTVVVKATTPPTITNTSFKGCPKNMVVIVPTSSVDDYKAADNWKSLANNIQGGAEDF